MPLFSKKKNNINLQIEQQKISNKILNKRIRNSIFRTNKSIKYNSNDIYIGDILYNSRHGKGTMTYKNGDIYEGNWTNNKKEGQGKMIYKNGDIYEGNWVNNKKEGYGTMTYKNSETYNGNWVNDKREGQGKIIYKNDDIYEGNWVNDKREGQGKMIYKNGDIYEGSWINDKREGKGKIIYKNNDKFYDDEWKNDKILYTKKSKNTTGNTTENTTENTTKNKNQKLRRYTNNNNIRKNNTITSRDKINITSSISKMKSLLVNKNTRRGLFLNSVCDSSGECIILGKENNKIKEFFENFTTFKYLTEDIKQIGANSNNGLIYQLKYSREIYELPSKKSYLSYAILKSNGKPHADNLMYEYYVGLFINTLCNIFPCFLETYGLFYSKSFLDLKNLSNYDLLDNLLDNLELIKNDKDINTNFEKYGCRLDARNKIINNYLLIQHINKSITLGELLDKSETELLQHLSILYQVFMPLSVLNDNFTHYDLNSNNILLYKLENDKFINFNYHYIDENGVSKVVSFNCEYIAKIIDYGKCYYYKNSENNSEQIKTIVCNLKECNKNNLPSCDGTHNGLGWLTSPDNTNLNSSVLNVSADLYFLDDLITYKSTPQYIQNILKKLNDKKTYKDMGKYVEIYYDSTPESGLPEKINNIKDLEIELRKAILDNEFQKSYNNTNNTNNYNDKNMLGTLDIYSDKKTPMKFQYKDPVKEKKLSKKIWKYKPQPANKSIIESIIEPSINESNV
jgi:hypothetical protein